MAKNPKASLVTKKHLARVERERLQKRYILIGSIIVVVLVFGLIGYGLLDQYVLAERKPVAVVNGEKIPTFEFQTYVRYRRDQLIRNAQNIYQYIQILGASPETQLSFGNQLENIQTQLSPRVVGQSVLDQMIETYLVKQETQKRGISVSEDEINKAIQDAFEYFPEGTPTTEPTRQPASTSTLSPTQLALIPPSPTATATAAVTVTVVPTQTPTETPVLTPTLTSTPYTLQGFQANYQEVVKNYQEDLGFSEENIREIFMIQILNKKLSEAILNELNISAEEEQVWARHILVNEEQTTKDLLAKLDAGQDWNKLAAEYSKDEFNKDRGGDLGWFGKGQMVPEFETVAYELAIGKISQPVKSQFGWHLIQVLGHENRPLSEEEYQNLRQQKYQEWLSQLREKSQVEIKDYWVNVIPDTPVLPDEILTLIEQIKQQQPTQVVIPTTEAITPTP